MRKWKMLVEDAVEFLEDMKQFDRIALLFHGCHDGFSAAGIISIYLEEFFGKTPNSIFPVIRSPYIITEDLITNIRKVNPDFIIALDLPLDRDPIMVQKLLEATGSTMFILDHHKPCSILNIPNCMYQNPRLLEPTEEDAPPPCYFVFHMYKVKKGTKNLCWLSAAGVVGDACVEICKDVIEEVKRHYPDLYPHSKISQKLAWNSKLGELTNILNTGRFYGDIGPKIVFDAIIKAGKQQNPNLFFSNDPLGLKLKMFRKKVDKEIAKESLLSSKRSKIFNDLKLLFYKTSLKMNIENAVVTNLRVKFPDYVVLLLSQKNDRTIFEIRRGSWHVDLTDLISNSLVGLNEASGGGHPAAGGGILLTKDISRFMKRVELYLKELVKEGK